MKLEAGSTCEVISRFDPALGESSNWEEYSRTLDESHLVFEGEPTRYTMRVLSRRQNDEIKISALCRKCLSEDEDRERSIRMTLACFDACFDDDLPFEARMTLGQLALSIGSLSRPTP